MIGAETDGEALAHDNLALLIDHRFFDDGPHGDDQRLGRIDDRAEAVDAVAAEIGNGDRTAGVFFRFEFFAPRTPGKIVKATVG